MLEYLAAVPNFLIYLATSGALLIAFMAAYMLATPQQDLALIRKGNVCASLVFSGTLIGFALPLAQLRWWLLGLPAPGEVILEQDAASGEIHGFTQDGWQLSIESRAPLRTKRA